MNILFLTHAFNSLTQRLFVELRQRGHKVSIEYDINDRVTIEAVEQYQPDLIIAPYLRRAIPEQIWKNHTCLIVHPGPVGDRGPSSLDWAVLEGKEEWGVTILQADAEMDAGAIWASNNFSMRLAAKGSLYRQEVMEAAVKGVLEAVENKPTPRALTDMNGWRDLMKQDVRSVDWDNDVTATVLRKIRAADGFPGVRDNILGLDCFLFDAHEEKSLKGESGEVIAQKNGAICVGTTDGAVWITHLKERREGEKTFKLPAVNVLGDQLSNVPVVEQSSWQDIWYERQGEVGYLHFPFYNGAMSTDQCQRLLEAYKQAASRDTKVLVLMGGSDFWSNGIHLNTIEMAESPADESWQNINAMDDLCRAIITTENQLTVAAMNGNAGAGGVFLGLCADKVLGREGIILNPHYKNMGNLFGSEYWTYVLPRRAGQEASETIMGNRLPLGCVEAKEKGLLDEVFDGKFISQVENFAQNLAQSGDYSSLLADKKSQRQVDEAEKPLEQYRKEELERMKLNFYGFDPSYHVARYNFVFKIPHSRTPLHLALHR
ncbi:MAG: hydrogenase maturation protein [Rhodospirillales bacterium]|nr:hydrogenase maturation protein [Rhodospirillales bacterium]